MFINKLKTITFGIPLHAGLAIFNLLLKNVK